ncbi:beta-xylosidase [Anaerocolumna cellulosilytica]|uniref:Beta-xylosidase n=1 Tax=Anaerocolumna cellulosilytica TaxID=433286 RepID=A0A6S6QRK0_9FIRM|nr:glycosyl hydrolase [Anaerocolumna cellulosilytica]MBB5196711.1 xylan 1,4-beta-xylosidase [Anaerocolumna cellulosilytica]BCJ93973.1 beta-xylosidase [Anaerocolumna cellulosilytica]
MKEITKVVVPQEAQLGFNNNAFFCVGTGRMGLALQKEYYEQLEFVQKDLQFSYIRGHGLFCDDMAVCKVYSEDGLKKVEYNFTYLDRVFDNYKQLGIKPFIELGFMPEELASGEQTIFYWKGNVTPPQDYAAWADLIQAVFHHWFVRYGREEVITWPVEVWNEPNLPGFWKDADMQEYFKLYEISVKAVKECDERIRVGGPAICGVDDERWLQEFLKFCSDFKVPLDFVTRHAYAADAPERIGHYDYQKLRDMNVFLHELKVSRDIIDSFCEYKGMEMHITEFNTSYSPDCPIHDTNLNAAYIAGLLHKMGDVCASYSYWTFGDVFEESGVAFTPFSGCFGLVANGQIPKPTYWAFHFFKQLGATALARNDNYIITKDEEGSLHGMLWNPVPLEAEPMEHKMEFTIALPLEDGEYVFITKLVDEDVCNPLKNWLDLGSPANPTKEQIALLRECARPQINTERFSVSQGIKAWEMNITLKKNALLYFKVQKIIPELDRGYQPDKNGYRL